MTNRNTTDVLQDDLDDNENVRWLHGHFIEEVEASVEKHLADELHRRIVARAVAETSLRRAINRAKRKPIYRENSELFRALLYRIAQRVRCKAIRAQQADKRDIRREAGGSDVVIQVTRDAITPAEQAAIREELRAGISELLREDEVERMLHNLLGCALGMNAAEIDDILSRHPDRFKRYTHPTIRSQIQRAQARVRAAANLD